MPIGLMSAMQEENSKLIAELGEDHHVIDKGMRRYHVGSLWEIPVVVVFSRWGKVAAATTATCLITEFNVGEIIFTGVAGGADPEVRVFANTIWMLDRSFHDTKFRSSVDRLFRVTLAAEFTLLRRRKDSF